MPIPPTIAIDGPAASGKSTLGKRLADDLGYLFFDTGVMYRAVTLSALQNGIAIGDAAGVTRLAETTHIDVYPPSQPDGRLNDVLLDGHDVTWEIRTPEVNDNVSQVSTYGGVRTALTAQQRRIGLRGRIVMVGRDIGTVVMPDAELKIYLDASAEARARRRYLEMLERDGQANYAEILANVRERDRIDSSRENAPLKLAADAIRVNSEDMDADQVFIAVKELVYSRDPTI